MHPPTKGKQATKGQQQIAVDNQATLTYYTAMLLAANAAYLGLAAFLFWDHFTHFYVSMFGVTSALYGAAYYIMKRMCRPVYGPSGNVVDGGIDLNMESGMGEHCKDVIIFTAIVQLLSVYSDWAWLLVLLVPLYVFYKLWVNFLGPWFFAPAPPGASGDGEMKKKVKKVKGPRR